MLMGHIGKSAEGCRKDFPSRDGGGQGRGREFYEEGLSLPSSFWILLCKNVMFRPRATICGYDGKKNERKNDPEY